MSSTDATYWDGEAATFDTEQDHGLLDPDVRSAWADRLRTWIPDPCDVLDLGCGTGSVSVLLAELGHRVTGVDFSPAMVELAAEKAARHGVDVTFRQGDAADPAAGGRTGAASYDVVLTRHVLRALPEPADAVARWARLLRPGGRFVLVEGWWSTGAGIRGETVTGLLGPHTTTRTVERLDDPRLWGRTIDDDRYAVVATT